MKILNETFKYLGKNLIFLIVFAIIPACFIGGLLNPFSILTFIVDYKNMEVKNFGNILVGLFNMSWMQVINWFLASIILILILSALLGNIENHFRSGKLNLSASTSFINNNILACVVYFLVYIVIYLAFKFVLALFIFILHIIFGKLGYAPSTVLYVLTCLLTFVSLAIFGGICMFLILGLIDTLNSGYSFITSMSNASELIRGNLIKILLFEIIPFAVIIPLATLGLLFNFSTISNIVGLIIVFIYYPVLGYTTYYELSGLTRYDNIKHYYYK